MPEKSNTNILDRDEACSHVDQYFGHQKILLEQIVNYGTNLIVRSWESSNKTFRDVIILSVLMKNIVSLIDSISIQFNSGSVENSKYHLRGIFESYTYLKFILSDKTNEKHLYYYVYEIRNRLKWVKRAMGAGEDAEWFQSASESAGINGINGVFDKERVDEEFNMLKGLLESKKYKEINRKFDDCRGKKKFDPAWYKPISDKLTSIRKLAEDVGLIGEYDIFYGLLSSTIHGDVVSSHVSFGDGVVNFAKLRRLDHASFVLNMTVVYIFKVYMSIIEMYRPQELPAFAKKYDEEWRIPFKTMPNIRYEINVKTK